MEETLQGPDPGHEVALARVQGHHGLAPGPHQGGGEAATPGPLCTSISYGPFEGLAILSTYLVDPLLLYDIQREP